MSIGGEFPRPLTQLIFSYPYGLLKFATAQLVLPAA